MKAVVLLSGGLDSSVAAAMLRARGARLQALFADYGQRAAPAEARASRRVARTLGIPWMRLDLRWLGALGGNALTSRARALPRPSGPMLDDPRAARRTAAAVWVPNRNGVLLNCAAAIAEARGYDAVAAGFNREEAATFPDNSRAYMRALDAAFRFSTRARVRVVSPTAGMTKAEIVRWAVRHGFDVSLCWPCYESGRAPCGTCESCRRFRRAAESHGIRFHGTVRA